jgi:uncharacterized protein YjbJ (UPF0337 family)
MKLIMENWNNFVNEEEELDEGFFDQLTSYAKGKSSSAKDAAPQNVVAAGAMKKIEKAMPALIQKLERLKAIIDQDTGAGKSGLLGSTLDDEIKMLSALSSKMGINEGILDRAKEIGSNIKGAVKGAMGRRKDAVTKAIYDVRKTINAISKIVPGGEQDLISVLQKVNDKVVKIQMHYSKQGRKTYGSS